ncbi:MAG: hypothetical protein A2939_04765 [Parcubacteria group bacterium RIFCSPLOWO2_01_FULL_48_18]|nr:MAG: hypothetical protein A3J67_00495 [Parcubacteria group bacterium RIFCSPHIGHO2_02_FULL_48_10b]OHB21669.1 MAG: hypothetical protein A2939_04765 [Parcubacteria group bacterium RIFCSPLOWO2_01_FULL_48_18]
MELILKQFEQDARAVIDGLRQELSGIRTGRANTLLVENIAVEAYGSKMPMKQLGSIGVVPPKEIVIQLWDQSVVNAAAKAIEASKLGLVPQVDGNTIHLNLPPLTAERRQELSKLANKITEEHKIKLRHQRDESNKKANELKDEDERFKTKEKVQEAIDKANKEIAGLLETKTKEINE